MSEVNEMSEWIIKLKEDFGYIYPGGDAKIQYDMLTESIDHIDNLGLFDNQINLAGAIKGNQVEMLEYLHKNGLDIFFDYDMLLAYACRKSGSVEIMKYLLEEGEKKNILEDHVNFYFILAVGNSNFEVIKYLGEKGGKYVEEYDFRD